MDLLTREFERFIGSPTETYYDRLHITIHPDGTILLNRKAFETMGKPQNVYLNYSRAKDTIVLEPTQVSMSNNAFPVKISGRQGGRRIQANPFCKHFRIKPEAALKFVSPHIDAVGRAFLKLTETVVVSRSPRKKK